MWSVALYKMWNLGVEQIGTISSRKFLVVVLKKNDENRIEWRTNDNKLSEMNETIKNYWTNKK